MDHGADGTVRIAEFFPWLLVSFDISSHLYKELGIVGDTQGSPPSSLCPIQGQ